MKWPWVSRRAYDLVVEQLEVERKRGRAGRKRAEIPKAVYDLVAGYDKPWEREDELRQICRLHSQVQSWDAAIQLYCRERGLPTPEG